MLQLFYEDVFSALTSRSSFHLGFSFLSYFLSKSCLGTSSVSVGMFPYLGFPLSGASQALKVANPWMACSLLVIDCHVAWGD